METNNTNINATIQINGSGGILELNIEPYYLILNVVNWSILAVVLTSLFGNTLIVIVMSLPHNRKTSTSVFFIALAISDILLVLLLPFERWLHWLTHKSVYGLSHGTAVIKVILNYSIVPHKIKMICSVKSSSRVLFCVIFFITAVNTAAFLMLADIEYTEERGPYWNSKVPHGREVIKNWDLCISFLVPLVIISVGSVVIITQLARVSLQKHDSRKGRNSPVTLKLLAANAVFITTLSPFCLFSEIADSTRMKPEVFVMVDHFLLLISDCNAALNFFVYCLSGTRFRADVKKLLCCK